MGAMMRKSDKPSPSGQTIRQVYHIVNINDRSVILETKDTMEEAQDWVNAHYDVNAPIQYLLIPNPPIRC